MVLPALQLFKNEWLNFGVFFSAILLLIGLSELFRSKLRWPPEVNRKLMHVIVGLMACCCPFIFSSNLPPMALAVVFIIGNGLAQHFKAFKSLHASQRTTYGTVYFPVAFLILVAFFWTKPITLILALLTMTIADTAAAFTGERVSHPLKFKLWHDEKSIQGSTAMFFASALIIYVGTDTFAWLFGAAFFLPIEILIGCAIFIGLLVALAETLSSQGSDNLSVPLVTAVGYELYLTNYTHSTLPLFLTWTIVSALVLYGAYRHRALTPSGAAGAYIMGIFIFGSGGIQWCLPILTFFILSSILSTLGKKFTKSTQKGANRDIVQVLANGTLPVVIAIVNFFRPFDFAYVLYLGVIAAATADTWATEIGFFSRRRPRHILKLQPIPCGTSGGVSLLGFGGSALGAAVIALTGYAWLDDPSPMLLITTIGFGGSVVDSLLGASIQAIFRCQTCGNETEKRIHCKRKTNHRRGWKWLDNNGVNFANTIVTATIMFLIKF